MLCALDYPKLDVGWRTFQCFSSFFFIFHSSNNFSARLCPLWAKLMLHVTGAQFKCIWEPPWELLFSFLRGFLSSADVPRFPSQLLSMTLEKAFLLGERVLSSYHSLICTYFGGPSKLVSGWSPMVLGIPVCLGIDWETCLKKGLWKDMNNPFWSLLIPSLAEFEPVSSSISDYQYLELSHKVSKVAS